MPKFRVGSRFYIHSRDKVDPAHREPGNRILIVISHGYYKPGCGTTTVRGLFPDPGRCTFFARVDQDADVAQVSAGLIEMVRNAQSNGGFYETPMDMGQAVLNYTLVKGMNKNFKGAEDYRYVDSVYIDSVYPANATFDVIALHNTLFSSSVRFSDLFDTLAAICPGRYGRLYCGFCRESAASAGA